MSKKFSFMTYMRIYNIMQTTFDSITSGFTKLESVDGEPSYVFSQDIVINTYPHIDKKPIHYEHDMTKLFFFGEIGREMGVSYSTNPSSVVSKRVAQNMLTDRDAMYMFRPKDFMYTRRISNVKMIGSATGKYEAEYTDISSFINNIAYSKHTEYCITPATGWLKIVSGDMPHMVNIAQYVCGNIQIASVVGDVVSHRIFRFQQDGELHVSASVDRRFDGYFIEATITKSFEPTVCVKINPDTSISINMYTILPDEQPQVFINRAITFPLNDILKSCCEAFLQTEYSDIIPGIDDEDNDLDNLNFEADLLFSHNNDNIYT